MTEHYLTDERRMIQETAREFTMKEVLPVANALDPVQGDIPMDLRARLDTVSKPVTPFPYSFFGAEIQGGITGGLAIGDKPVGYMPDLLMQGSFAGVS